MNSYEKEPGFLDRLRKFYVTNGHLTGEQFDAAARKGEEVIALKLLPGTWWGVSPTITSLYPQLLTSLKFQAQAAAFGVPFKGLEEYVRTELRESMMNRMIFSAKPGPKQKIGLLFHELGLITRTQLAMTLGVQQLVRDQTGLSPRFGLLAMRVAAISLPNLLQVVALQAGIPYENMDQFVSAYEKQFNCSACP